MKTSLYSKYEKPHVPLHSTGKGWKKRSLSLLWFPAESSTGGILRNKNGLLKVVGVQAPQTIHFLPKWYLDWWKNSRYKLDPVEISLPLGWDVSCNPEKTNWDMFQNLSKIKTSTYSTTSTGSSHDFQGFIAWFPGVSYIFSIVSSGTVRKNHWGLPNAPTNSPGRGDCEWRRTGLERKSAISLRRTARYEWLLSIFP